MSAQITKIEGFECYGIRNGGEYGTICIRSWVHGPLNEHHAGEILAHTSFGDYAYTWGSMGCPLKQFLIEAAREGSRSYIMGKLAGERLMEFDAEATLEAALQSVIESRRNGDASKEEAREAYDAIKGIDIMFSDSSGHDIIGKLSEIEFFRNDYYEMAQKRINPQCAGFWDNILRPFVECLKDQGSITKAAA